MVQYSRNAQQAATRPQLVVSNARRRLRSQSDLMEVRRQRDIVKANLILTFFFETNLIPN